MRQKLLVLSVLVLLALAFFVGSVFATHASPQLAPGYQGGNHRQLAPDYGGGSPLAPASEGNWTA